MIFERLNEKDFDFVVEKGRELHSRSIYSSSIFPLEKVRNNFNEVIKADPRELIGIKSVKDDGSISGIIVLAKLETQFSYEKIAIETFFWTDGNPKSFLMLIKASEEWARKVGVKTLTLASFDGNQRIRKIYEKKGFKVTGMVFTKDLN